MFSRVANPLNSLPRFSEKDLGAVLSGDRQIDISFACAKWAHGPNAVSTHDGKHNSSSLTQAKWNAHFHQKDCNMSSQTPVSLEWGGIDQQKCSMSLLLLFYSMMYYYSMFSSRQKTLQAFLASTRLHQYLQFLFHLQTHIQPLFKDILRVKPTRPSMDNVSPLTLEKMHYGFCISVVKTFDAVGKMFAEGDDQFLCMLFVAACWAKFGFWTTRNQVELVLVLAIGVEKALRVTHLFAITSSERLGVFWLLMTQKVEKIYPGQYCRRADRVIYCCQSGSEVRDKGLTMGLNNAILSLPSQQDDAGLLVGSIPFLVSR